MSFTVLATPRSFAKNDDAPIRLLEEQGCTVIRLPMNGGDLQAQLLEQLPQADAVIAGLEPLHPLHAGDGQKFEDHLPLRCWI